MTMTFYRGAHFVVYRGEGRLRPWRVSVTPQYPPYEPPLYQSRPFFARHNAQQHARQLALDTEAGATMDGTWDYEDWRLWLWCLVHHGPRATLRLWRYVHGDGEFPYEVKQ